MMLSGQVAAALTAARRLVADDPRDYEARILLAEALLTDGHPPDALAEINRAAQYGGLGWTGVALQARTLAQLGDFDAMRLSIEELRGLAAGNVGRVVEVEMLLGTLEETASHDGQALHAFEQALRLVPNAAALRGAMRCAQRLGVPDRVESAKRALCELEPAAPECLRR